MKPARLSRLSHAKISSSGQHLPWSFLGNWESITVPMPQTCCPVDWLCFLAFGERGKAQVPHQVVYPSSSRPKTPANLAARPTNAGRLVEKRHHIVPAVLLNLSKTSRMQAKKSPEQKDRCKLTARSTSRERKPKGNLLTTAAICSCHNE